jgi:hypothetical protein
MQRSCSRRIKDIIMREHERKRSVIELFYNGVLKRRKNGAGRVLDERKPLGYSLGEGKWGRGGEGMTKGIPAANHAPLPVTRMRSTGLVQVFGGAGESES